jgi:hypothetical protein
MLRLIHGPGAHTGQCAARCCEGFTED